MPRIIARRVSTKEPILLLAMDQGLDPDGANYTTFFAEGKNIYPSKYPANAAQTATARFAQDIANLLQHDIDMNNCEIENGDNFDSVLKTKGLL